MPAKSEKACDLISELYWVMRKAFEERLEELGVTFLEFKALVHLKSAKTQKDLLKEMNVSKSTASKVLSSLERKGIVKRERRGKAYIVELTDKGLEVLKAIEEAGKELEEKMFAQMTSKEKSEFLSLLKKAIDGLEVSR
ncbi:MULTISPECIES: MarR family winged helix-turn-helix transcriptional regulator [Thermococcus]|uniref:Regulatory protein, MarR n=1 Tax=Thermococcus sibiricus (strain DSM 12597 / MM 739) TaxID=604354 RepID=C6A583_THESM|nr:MULTISPECIES: MarR family transcriptional regulator [Thermococcus]ACS90778.1 Regulatory protein, MarR [Thermococcus sibiricus MM 739]